MLISPVSHCPIKRLHINAIRSRFPTHYVTSPGAPKLPNLTWVRITLAAVAPTCGAALIYTCWRACWQYGAPQSAALGESRQLLAFAVWSRLPGPKGATPRGEGWGEILSTRCAFIFCFFAYPITGRVACCCSSDANANRYESGQNYVAVQRKALQSGAKPGQVGGRN